MKTTLPVLALAAALITGASAASYTVSSGDAVNLGISGSDINFVMPQFDTSLGTLTGVTVSITQSNLGGTFDVTNGGLTGIQVDAVSSDYRVRQVTSGLGYTQQFLDIAPLVTTPVSNPSPTINLSQTLTFTITAAQGYIISDQVIGEDFFGAYEGPGTVTFGIRNRLIVTTTGAIFTVDTADSYTTSQMAITYTYQPIPEPSAALLGGLGALALLRRRRR